MPDWLIDVIRLGATGIVAGLFTSFVANKDYRYRKWWELRVAAYQAVIEALSDLSYYYTRLYDSKITYNEISDEGMNTLSGLWKDGYHKVRKAADAGAFLFSEEAESALKQFIKSDEENSQNDNLVDAFDSASVEAKKCLVSLVACSKNDLRLKKFAFLEGV